MSICLWIPIESRYPLLKSWPYRLYHPFPLDSTDVAIVAPVEVQKGGEIMAIVNLPTPNVPHPPK